MAVAEQAVAQVPPSCEQEYDDCVAVMVAAKKALNDKKAELDKVSSALELSYKDNQNLQYQIQKQQDQEHAWYHDPYKTATGGAIIGIIIYSLLIKPR